MLEQLLQVLSEKKRRVQIEHEMLATIKIYKQNQRKPSSSNKLDELQMMRKKMS